MPFLTTNADVMPLLFLALLLAAAIVLIALFFAVSRQRRQTARELESLSMDMAERVAGMEEALLRQSLEQREELLRSLQRLNDSLLNMMQSVTRSQGEQVNALLKQSYDNAQAFDQRQQGMQRITEDSLRRFEERMQSIEAGTGRLLAQNEARMEGLRKAVEEGMRVLSTENGQKLEEMRKTVDEKLHDTLEKRLNDSFAQVSARLEQVYKSLGEVHSLASGVGDLKRMLGNVKTRGVWGEMQLGALLEQALTSTQYARNVAVVPGSPERVEFAVCLPGREGDSPVYLPIDSKFPQEDYAARTPECRSRGGKANRKIYRSPAHHGLCRDVPAAGGPLCRDNAPRGDCGAASARPARADFRAEYSAGAAQQSTDGLSYPGHRAAVRRGMEAAWRRQIRFWRLCSGFAKDAGETSAGDRQHRHGLCADAQY